MRFHSKQDTISVACIRDLACNRDMATISTNYLTPSLYPGLGIYAGPGFYAKFYGICVHTRSIQRPLKPATQLDNDIDTALLAAG